jgi:putative nucleotidyltransferase with HDIG domain
VVERTPNLLRLFGVLKALVEMGPVATADRDFADTVQDILERTLGALDAVQGSLFIFDSVALRFSCVASIGFETMEAKGAIEITHRELQEWTHSREPHVVKTGEHPLYFSASAPKYAETVECLMPLRVGSVLAGAFCLGKRQKNHGYGEMELEAISLLAGHLALMLHNHVLAESLRLQISDNLRLLSSLNHSYEDALEAFATTIDAKDHFMRGHSMRVGHYAADIAASLGLSEAEVSSVRASGQLHDIGKVTVDKGLANKATALNPAEFREIADHTVIGHQIVQSVRFPWREVPDVVRWHHERADGSGYPDKLHSQELALPVRIIAVADTFDAMTHKRPYRQPMTMMQAAEELVQLTPTKFDPDVVQGLLVQLRAHSNGKSKLAGKDAENHPKISPVELDRLSVSLVHKLTGNRVYSA